MKSTHLMALSGVTVACLLALSAPAMAGDDIDVSLKNGGLKIKSGGSEFSIGGKIQMDYVDFGDDKTDNGVTLGDGSNNRRTHLEFKGTINDHWSFVYERDFAAQKTKAAYIAYKGLGWGTLKLGQDKKPFSLAEVTSDSWIPFMERSSATNTFGDDSAYGIGINYGGSINDTVGLWFSLQGDDTSGDKSGNDPRWLTARMIVSPVHTADNALHFGAGVKRGDFDNTEVSSIGFGAKPDMRSEATGSIASAKTSADSTTMYNLEFAGVWGGFSTSAEYYKAKVKGVSGSSDYDFDGWYVEGGMFLTGGSRTYKFGDGKFDRPSVKDSWELVARYSDLDLTDAQSSSNPLAGDASAFTVGLNYYPNPAVKLSFDVTRSKVDNNNFTYVANNATKTVSDESFTGVGVRAQVAF